MGNIYLKLLLLCFCWHFSYTQNSSLQKKPKATVPPREILVRNDKHCAIPYRRASLSQCDWHYIAYFPRIFRSDVTEHVMISTQGFPFPVSVTVSIIKRNGDVIVNETQEIQPDKLETVPITVPHNSPSSVKVKIEGRGTHKSLGKIWIFSNTSESITVEKLGMNIIIQTDRPIYKPGQLIRSRVIVVDTNLRPYNGSLDSVIIANPSGSIMRKWMKTKLQEGFASFDLKTSVKPVLGNWKIKVKLLSYKKELTIQVKEYVLPKFQVTIKPPSFISKMMNSITAEVCAKYSYGKNVVGKLEAKICKRLTYNYYSRKRGEKKPKCITIAKKIDGCTDITIDLYQLIAKNSNTDDGPPPFAQYIYQPYTYTNLYISFDAKVKEKATGLVMNATSQRKHMLSKDVELSIESKKVFKPGFPMKVKLFAKYPDGEPIKSITINVTVTGNSMKDLMRNQEVKVTNGVHDLRLPPIPFQAKSLDITIWYVRKSLFPKESFHKRKSTANSYLTPWYSPSHSYLNIQKPKGDFKIGEKAEIVVGYTSVDEREVKRKISYSMMCAGNLVESGSFHKTFIAAAPTMSTTPTTPTMPTTQATTKTIKIVMKNGTVVLTRVIVPLRKIIPVVDWDWWRVGSATRPPLPFHFSSGTFKFSFEVNRKMLPSCKMIVYYVRREEVIADEIEIGVVNEFENKITLKFDETKVRPGEKVKLIVTGAPNSRIAVAAIDKSIHYLAKGNDITPKQLLGIREQLNIRPGWVSEYGRCPRSYGYGKRKKRMIWPGYGSTEFVDSEKAFANIGVSILSSLHVDVRPCQPIRPIMMRMKVSTTTGFGGGPPPENARKGGPRGKTGAKTKSKKKATRVRTEFPETWLWTDEKLSKDGTKVYEVQVPDTITTWYASGFGISKAAGLGVANPTKLLVFQPFFISINLPYSVIRGEDVTIPAAIFSYLDNACMTIKVSLKFSDQFKMIAGPSAKTCLCAGRTATVLFRIRPKVNGYIKIHVSASTLNDNQCRSNLPFTKDVNVADIMVKKLLVEPEGVKEEYTRSSFFCQSNKQSKPFKTNFKLKVPDNLVPNSIFAKVTAMGDIMGASLSNIDELLAMPYGCGEQNMLKFAPNIFIMNYLKNTNQVTEEIKTKALNYMRTGYQKELTYKHKDGSYSAFGDRDHEGSTWLSAFVLKSYAQAIPWIDIDEEEIKATQKWLLEIQSRDGCFPKIGKLHNKAMKGGVKTPATLTAYVLISLLEANISTERINVKAAAQCIVSNFDKFKNDSYSLSIMAYLFAKLKYIPSYKDAIKYLDNMAIKEDGMTHWEEKRADKPPERRSYYYKARSTDIEQSAYVLLAILEFGGKKALKEAVPIVKWLAKQRNSLGGWQSTQDTVLAMQALALFAEINYSGTGSNSMDIKIVADKFSHNFKINEDNKLVLQRVEEVPVPSTLKITGVGEGCALVQTNVKYNVMKVKVKPTFKISHKITSVEMKLNRRKSCRSQHITVCGSWLGSDESNMAIIEIQMVSGFEADAESFEGLRKKTKHLKDIEVKGKNVVFYFSRIKKTPSCVKIRVDQVNNVRETKPAAIKVYDYYDTEKSATTMYKFTEEQCIGK